MTHVFSHGYALLIGVGACVYGPYSLPVTVKDVTALKSVLLNPELCAFPDDGEHVKLLHDTSATRQAIVDGLEWLQRQTDLDSDSTAIVYYSGHGWLDQQTETYYLIPHDVNPQDIAGSALEGQTFSAHISRIRAKRLLVLVDSCHAAGMASSKDDPLLDLPDKYIQGALPKELADSLRRNSGRAVFSSSSGLQRSWIRPDGSFSIFTDHLLEALRGAGNRPDDTEVRISNLMNYLARAVPASAARYYNAEQVPFFDSATEDFAVALLAGGKAANELGSTSYQVSIRGRVYYLTENDEVGSATAGARGAVRPYMAPLPPPQGVLGREESLAGIYDLLQLGNEAQVDVPPVALHGMGGIGKTTLAATLGRLNTIPSLFPDGVLWVSLGPNPSVRLLLNGWGRALGVDLLPERDELACQERLQAVLYHRKVLLLIDDVWDVSQGKHFLISGPHGRTLLTTREAPIAFTLATRQRALRVDVLKADDAMLLLRRLAPEAVMSDEATARRVCDKLEYLPLALTLAGRMLAVEADVPRRMMRLLSELAERRDARLHLTQAEGRLGLLADQPVSLAAILGMSIDRLDKVDRQRFAMLAVFGGEPLTWDIEATAAVWECRVEEAEVTMSHCVQRGLVTHERGAYRMHALLADYAEQMMEEMQL